jgi:peptidoglycan/LPS O-acetylase OafA/YrhL
MKISARRDSGAQRWPDRLASLNVLRGVLAPRARTDAADFAYRPDLDGLRAVAVGLVILTHAHWPWTNNGGDAGVTAFFVLSGYLITGILQRQLEREGSVRVADFYRRRVTRLAPALLGLLAFTVAIGLWVGWVSDWRLGVVSCLVYVSNWVQVAGVPIGPLGHTWSLAIEEQFYLVWPAVMILARARIAWTVVLGVPAMTLLRVTATGPFEYFSTVTRADAILLGCGLAVWQPSWSPRVAAAGVVTLVGAALMIPAENHDLAILVAMLASAAVIGGRLDALGRLAPIGLRAYSLYLWNWPMTLLFGSFGLLATVMTVLVAEISFRLLEAPVLHRGRRPRSRHAEPARPAVLVGRAIAEP